MFCQRISQLHKKVTYVPNKWITCPNRCHIGNKADDFKRTVSPKETVGFFNNQWQRGRIQMKLIGSSSYQTDGWPLLMEKHTDGSYMALHGLYIYSYMETSCALRIKNLPHDFHLPKMGSIPQDVGGINSTFSL